MNFNPTHTTREFDVRKNLQCKTDERTAGAVNDNQIKKYEIQTLSISRI